jgi:hypothetical protein
MSTFIVSPNYTDPSKINLCFSVRGEEPSTLPEMTEAQAQEAIVFASHMEPSIVIGVRLTRPQAILLMEREGFLKALLDLVGDTKSED